MPAPTFKRLNHNWNAEPNAPAPRVIGNGSTLTLTFFLNHMVYQAREEEIGQLTFEQCSIWRLGAANDEGWFKGQCRYSRIAPDWGEFYEVLGNDDLQPHPDDWHTMSGVGSRHFLFYLRDETFECRAAEWKFTRGSGFT